MSTNANGPTPDDWTREVLAPRHVRPASPLPAPVSYIDEIAHAGARARLAAAYAGLPVHEVAEILFTEPDEEHRWERVRAALEDDDRLLGPAAPAPVAVRATIAYAAYRNVPHEVGIRDLYWDGKTPLDTHWARVGALTPDDLR